MPDLDLTSEQFLELATEILQKNRSLRFRARGRSMRPFIRDGDMLEIEPVESQDLRSGDIVLVNPGVGHLLVHRIMCKRRISGEQHFLLQGDALRNPDGWFKPAQVLGRVVSIERNGRTKRLDGYLSRIGSFVLVFSLTFFKGFYNCYKQFKMVFERKIGE